MLGGQSCDSHGSEDRMQHPQVPEVLRTCCPVSEGHARTYSRRARRARRFVGSAIPAQVRIAQTADGRARRSP